LTFDLIINGLVLFLSPTKNGCNESFEIVKEPFEWKGKVITNYVFKIKDNSEDWGDDIDVLYDSIDFIFSMLFPLDNETPIAVWDIKYI
jgi:hypothetical protein